MKIIGTARKSGNSAIVLPRKYALVRYNRPRDSRMKMGNSDEKTWRGEREREREIVECI